MDALKAIEFFMPFILVLLWYLFGMYSDTANNHGRVIAFLLPLAPLLFIVMYALFAISRVLVYPFFVLSGKKHTYNNFINVLKNPWLWGFNGVSKKVNKDQEKIKH